jgi:hypothetical protein
MAGKSWGPWKNPCSRKAEIPLSGAAQGIVEEHSEDELGGPV